MYQRLVCSLLLFTVLLTQWASAAHCRGCGKTGENHRSPHIHLTGFFSPCAIHDDEDDGHQDDGHQEGGVPTRHQENPSDSHDDDCVVYLSMSSYDGWFMGRVASETEHVINSQQPDLGGALLSHVQSSVHSLSPLACLRFSSCPTYLRTLTLLI